MICIDQAVVKTLGKITTDNLQSFMVACLCVLWASRYNYMNTFTYTLFLDNHSRKLLTIEKIFFSPKRKQGAGAIGQ